MTNLPDDLAEKVQTALASGDTATARSVLHEIANRCIAPVWEKIPTAEDEADYFVLNGVVGMYFRDDEDVLSWDAGGDGSPVIVAQLADVHSCRRVEVTTEETVTISKALLEEAVRLVTWLDREHTIPFPENTRKAEPLVRAFAEHGTGKGL